MVDKQKNPFENSEPPVIWRFAPEGEVTYAELIELLKAMKIVFFGSTDYDAMSPELKKHFKVEQPPKVDMSKLPPGFPPMPPR